MCIYVMYVCMYVYMYVCVYIPVIGFVGSDAVAQTSHPIEHPCDHHKQLCPSASPRRPLLQPTTLALGPPKPSAQVHGCEELLPFSNWGNSRSMELRGVGMYRAPWPETETETLDMRKDTYKNNKRIIIYIYIYIYVCVCVCLCVCDIVVVLNVFDEFFIHTYTHTHTHTDTHTHTHIHTEHIDTHNVQFTIHL